ncbi:hypothetical protein M446_4164 [Methylobacterium sp. 4-46]|nr:hypothetical protein M446_4164 [Methylobacterium sp. 4-46]
MDARDGSAAERAYATIKREIIYNRFGVCSQLKTDELRRKHHSLGITPIRDALIKLNQQDFIDYTPNIGYFTRVLTTSNFMDHYNLELLHLKYAIESGALPFAGEGLDPPSLFDAPESTGEAEATQSSARFIENVYGRIARMSENRKLVRHNELFCDHTAYIRELGLERTKDQGTIIDVVKRLAAQLANDERAAAIDTLVALFDRKIALLDGSVNEGNNRALVITQGVRGGARAR